MNKEVDDDRDDCKVIIGNGCMLPHTENEIHTIENIESK